jgi:mannose-6-phosphate isomerase-like protein (cupin superfamily)
MRYNPNLHPGRGSTRVEEGRSRMKIKGLLVLLLAGFAVAAGDPPGFKLWTPSDLKTYEKQMAQKLGPTKAATQQLIDFGTHLTMMAYRETDGEAEVHEGVSDIFYVISGDATLVVGGKAIGLKSTGPGELRGTSIQGGVSKKLAAGDIVNIPAKTPHQTLVKSGQKVTYFVVKVKTK